MICCGATYSRYSVRVPLCLVLVASMLLCGCKEDQKSTVAPVLPTVQINPIVVLKPGEQIGGSSNRGCRLTKAQMTDHLNNLNNFAKQHWKFQISFPVQGSQVNPQSFEDTQLVQADLPGNPGARRFPALIWLMASLPTANNLGLWDSNRVNVFFTGNVQVDFQFPTETRANTVDPSDAQGQVVRHIYINDFGFVTGSANTNLTWHVLPHELCHYLIRQKATQGGRYDTNEHAGANVNQLMKPKTPHPAIVVTADAKEVITRVRAGLENTP